MDLRFKSHDYINVSWNTVEQNIKRSECNGWNRTGDNFKETDENNKFELFIYVDRGQIGGSVDAA